MNAIPRLVTRGPTELDQVGDWIGMLGIRLMLACEFGSAGLEKWHGDNGFIEIRDAIPFPFSVVPVDISWFLATRAELIGAAVLAVVWVHASRRRRLARIIEHVLPAASPG